jgi:phenylacetate-CoA ligase
MNTFDLQRQFFEMLMDSQWWSADKLRNYQRTQLSQLLRHAKRSVPFYEHRLDAVVRPNGDIDWNRWSEIPIVKRRDMIDYRDAMQASELPPGHGPTSVSETSGSTGLSIKVTLCGLGTLANNGLRLRVHRWQELDWSKILCSRMGDAQHAKDWPDGQPMGFWGPPWDEDARRGGLWKISRTMPSDFLFEFMKEHNCTYLNAGPNMAHINALDAIQMGIDIKIEAILVQGNVVRQEDRDICKRVFGAKIVEHYSSKEGGHMAHPCPHGRLHINSEVSFVEVLDEDDNPVAPGGSGRVIVTPLFQTAQPLIRYEQGDLVTLGYPCPCGRHSQTIETIQGRSIAIFRHPSGRAVANLMPSFTSAVLGAQYWQLAQVGPNDYEFRYVPSLTVPLGDEAAVRQIFLSTFFEDASLRFVRAPSIALRDSGKLAEYVNEWAPAH